MIHMTVHFRDMDRHFWAISQELEVLTNCLFVWYIEYWRHCELNGLPGTFRITSFSKLFELTHYRIIVLIIFATTPLNIPQKLMLKNKLKYFKRLRLVNNLNFYHAISTRGSTNISCTTIWISYVPGLEPALLFT